MPRRDSGRFARFVFQESWIPAFAGNADRRSASFLSDYLRCHPGRSEAESREPLGGASHLMNGSRIALRASGMTSRGGDASMGDVACGDGVGFLL